MGSASLRTSQASFKQKIQLSQMRKIVTSSANLFVEEKGALYFGTTNVEMFQGIVPTNYFLPNEPLKMRLLALTNCIVVCLRPLPDLRRF